MRVCDDAARGLGHGEHRERAHQGQQDDGGDPGHGGYRIARTKMTPTITAPATIAKA